MGYKTILVYVNESRHTRERVKIATHITLQENAHLIGMAASAIPAQFYLPGAIGESTPGLDIYLEFMRERAQCALTECEGFAQQAGVLSFEKRIEDDEAGIGLSMQARYSDLVVIGQTDPDESLPGVRTDLPQYVVMNSGRPVLIVPYAGQFSHVGKNVLIAWDASMEATRAVTFALPLLGRANTVQVAVFNPQKNADRHGTLPGADIALYLARHGIQVEASQQKTAAGIDVGSALLSHAADMDADLIVMGGYGHSRFREMLLGGVTDTILKSMTIPVLMAH